MLDFPNLLYITDKIVKYNLFIYILKKKKFARCGI